MNTLRLVIMTIALLLPAIISPYMAIGHAEEPISNIMDFSVMLSNDPCDVNKDGQVNESDIQFTRRGYNMAINYAGSLPEHIKDRLDTNKDHMITEEDCSSVTRNISKIIIINKRINLPVFSFASIPSLDYVYISWNTLSADKGNSEKFDSLYDYYNFAGPIEYRYKPIEDIKIDTNRLKDGTADEKSEMAIQAFLQANAETAKGAGGLARSFDIDSLIESYKLEIGFLDRTQKDLHEASPVIGVSGNIPLIESEPIFTRHQERINKNRPKSQKSSETKEGPIKRGSEDVVYTEQVIAIGRNDETGRVIYFQETRTHHEKYNSQGILIGYYVDGQILDLSTRKTVESYRKVATEIDSNGTIRKEVKTGSIIYTNGIMANYNTTYIYDGSGQLTSMSSSLIVRKSTLQILGTYSVVYTIDDKGRIVETHVYDSRGQERSDLGGQYEKQIYSIIVSLYPSSGNGGTVTKPIVAPGGGLGIGSGISISVSSLQGAPAPAPAAQQAQAPATQSSSAEDSSAAELLQQKTIESQVAANQSDDLFTGKMVNSTKTDQLISQMK